MLILYVICRVSVVIVIIILFMEFDYWMLMLFELYTLIFYYLVSNFRSSYERGRANVFIMVFGFVMRFRVVMSNSMTVMRMVLLILRMAKLPIYRLHI